MGYEIKQQESSFFIAKQYVQDALNAIRKMPYGERAYSWISPNDAATAPSIVAALYAWRWFPIIDDHGNIDALYFRGEKAGSDNALFETIARFVRPHSYIRMRGEDGELWRWYFKDGEVQRQKGRIVWED